MVVEGPPWWLVDWWRTRSCLQGVVLRRPTVGACQDQVEIEGSWRGRWPADDEVVGSVETGPLLRA